MARRQGSSPFTAVSTRPSKPVSRPSSYPLAASSSDPAAIDKRQLHDHNSGRSMRFWLLLLIATFFLFERAAVFAAPSPHQFAAAALSHINTTIARNVPSRDAAFSRNSANDAHLPARNARLQASDASAPQASITNPPANIAYFIQVSENTVHHLPRLLRAVHHEKNVYAVHFDLKIPHHLVKTAVDKLRSVSKYDDNVHVMPSELITYRGISMLLNTINAMRLLLDSDDSWHYFINLSGADYPLLTPQTTRKLLGHKLGLNFFTFAPKRTWDSMAENRLAEVWYDESLTFRRNASIGQLSKLDVRNPLVDGRQFEVSHAEAWMISSRDFCDFVVRGDMARKMLVAFAYAVDSSEHYFASLAWNHDDFKKSLVPHSLRMIVWLHDGVLSGQHPYFIDEKNADGSYKFEKDLSQSVLFFARKFDKPDSPMMDYIDERAKEKPVITSATNHIVAKVNSRELRLSEL